MKLVFCVLLITATFFVQPGNTLRCYACHEAYSTQNCEDPFDKGASLELDCPSDEYINCFKYEYTSVNRVKSTVRGCTMLDNSTYCAYLNATYGQLGSTLDICTTCIEPLCNYGVLHIVNLTLLVMLLVAIKISY